MSGAARPSTYDAMVVGLGAMGTAATWHLARRGLRVLACDRFPRGHTFGSSHGESRMIREIYYEASFYVPIVRRAFELWRELEEIGGRSLLESRGGLMLGSAGGQLVRGAQRTATEHKIPVEILSSSEIRALFPAFQVDDTLVAVRDPRAGYLHAERCLQAMREDALRHGAELRFDAPVLDWTATGSGVRVRTPDRIHDAGWLVVTVGPWTGSLLADLRLGLEVERQVLFWFEPAGDPSRFDPEHSPVYLWEFEPGRLLYGFPRLEGGVKASVYHEGAVYETPEEVPRDVEPSESRELARALEALLPGVAGRLVASQVCLFTNTPDKHFLIDFHPGRPRILVCSACSGHGFKFASVVGEILADLVSEGGSRFDLQPFGIERLLPC